MAPHNRQTINPNFGGYLHPVHIGAIAERERVEQPENLEVSIACWHPELAGEIAERRKRSHVLKIKILANRFERVEVYIILAQIAPNKIPARRLAKIKSERRRIKIYTR